MAKKEVKKIEYLYEGTSREGKRTKGECFAISEILAKQLCEDKASMS